MHVSSEPISSNIGSYFILGWQYHPRRACKGLQYCDVDGLGEAR